MMPSVSMALYVTHIDVALADGLPIYTNKAIATTKRPYTASKCASAPCQTARAVGVEAYKSMPMPTSCELWP